MRALDGAGRHAEALEVYGQAGTTISGELGVDPGAELRQLHADLLAKDSAAAAGSISAGTVAAPGPPEPVPASRTARAGQAGRPKPGPAPRSPRSCPPTSPTSPAATNR